MITFHKYEGKSKEEVFNQCYEELQLNEEEIFTFEEIIEGGLFKGKKYTLQAISKPEIIDYIKEFVKELGNKMNLDIHCEIHFKENTVEILLVSDNNSILIGKDGKNLNALQIIIRQVLSDLNSFGLRILVDASNYKSKKLKNLEYEIKKICKEVTHSKVEVKLDPMNSYERRCVHSIVSEFENLQSISYGEGKERYTVIKYKD